MGFEPYLGCVSNVTARTQRGFEYLVALSAARTMYGFECDGALAEGAIYLVVIVSVRWANLVEFAIK